MTRLVASAVFFFALLACRDSKPVQAASDGLLPLPDTTVPVGGGGFVLRTVADSATSYKPYKYQVFVPKGFDRTRKWPVIVYLAGSGGNGIDGTRQTQGGLGDFMRAHAESFPAVVVFPQSPRGEGGIGRRIFLRLIEPSLDSAMKEFNGDPNRVYIVGFSYGASVAFEMLPKLRPRIAGLVSVSGPICTGCITNDTTAAKDSLFAPLLEPIKTLPVWIFQGGEDKVVPLASTRLVVSMLERVGSPIRYTEIPGGPHGITAEAFATPELFTWLLAQRRSP